MPSYGNRGFSIIKYGIHRASDCTCLPFCLSKTEGNHRFENLKISPVFFLIGTTEHCCKPGLYFCGASHRAYTAVAEEPMPRWLSLQDALEFSVLRSVIGLTWGSTSRILRTGRATEPALLPSAPILIVTKQIEEWFFLRAPSCTISI